VSDLGTLASSLPDWKRLDQLSTCMKIKKEGME
jgi:hypothetical protein